ncbi:MAG TPA: aminotransferase class V-fold PLP-dependent enzyme [Acetobacteraceae bacterium]|nr:aminotransferase class V-fold PLP-dependent enzyme [Acetobacteraceae bacterium]
MLPSQRHLFDIPRDVCYLNAASWSPLPLAAMEAGRAAMARKGRPWTVPADFAATQFERARRAAAALINADPADVALIPSVSYGVATAGKLFSPPPGTRVLLLQNDHVSPVLEWRTRATTADWQIETVPQPSDGDWTAALLTAIERQGARPVSLASISSVHWSDGCAIDLPHVAAALRRHGAALLIDATHAAGVMALDVHALDPDFVVFPTYKWVLGPYGRAFPYVARRHQAGEPLEQTGAARRAVTSEHATYLRDLAYVDNARRFDMGERDFFVSLEMASIGMEQVAAWGWSSISERLRLLTDRLADGLRGSTVQMPSEKLRAPHILSLGFPAGMPEDLSERLAAAQVYAAVRLGRLRISPHVYNDETDVDRFIQVFSNVIAKDSRPTCHCEERRDEATPIVSTHS